MELLEYEAGEVLEAARQTLGISAQEFEAFVQSVGCVAVIRERGQAAGFVWMEKRDRVLHVHGIVVNQPFRRRGIATEVLSLLEAEYGDVVDTIELGVHQANHQARALYAKLGYRTVHRVEEIGFHILRKAL